MARRIQRGPVRRGGNAAQRGALALRRAALVALLAAAAELPARAARAQPWLLGQADLLAGALPDLPSVWSEPGRPGFTPEAWWGSGFPWTWAGHVRGSWTTGAEHDAGAAFPGGARARETPLGWVDSVATVAGGAGAWRGFESGSVRVEPWIAAPRPGPRAPARADLVLAGGSSAYDENALALSRSDTLMAARFGVRSWKRGDVEALGAAGRHHYEAALGFQRGRHAFDGGISHRGAAASLPDFTLGQDARGESGYLAYRVATGAGLLGVRAGRAYEGRESFGGAVAPSRRDAEQVSGDLTLSGAGIPWRARLEVREEHVVRLTADSLPVDRRARSAWIAVAAEGRRGPARLEASIGAGRHGELGETAVAPSVAFHFGEGVVDARAFFERVLAAVWSDLAPGQEPFLQSTWSGGLDAGLALLPGLRARGGWVMGRTRQRAVVERHPIEEVWLRTGFRADPQDYDFALLTGSAEWRFRSWTLGAEGYQLFREVHAVQAGVDPRRGGRSFLEARFRAFRDLTVRMRAEAEAVGARQAEAAPHRWLEGYVSFGAGATFTLADATLSLRFRNLENEKRPQTWIDPRSGTQALGPGTEFRMAFHWRLFN